MLLSIAIFALKLKFLYISVVFHSATLASRYFYYSSQFIWSSRLPFSSINSEEDELWDEDGVWLVSLFYYIFWDPLELVMLSSSSGIGWVISALITEPGVFTCIALTNEVYVSWFCGASYSLKVPTSKFTYRVKEVSLTLTPLLCAFSFNSFYS